MCAERGCPGTSWDVPDHEGTRDLKDMWDVPGHEGTYGTWDLKDVCRERTSWDIRGCP